MYTIKVDDLLLYSPELLDAGYRVLNPSLHLEVNMAGSLSFLLPPSNVMYDSIHKMKSIITVEQDGEIIFRGRVLEEMTDFYKQKNVYCEGELSFLLDSLQPPATYKGTAAEIFAQLLELHNSQVEGDKRFTLGMVTAVTDEDTIDYDVNSYTDTSSVVEMLLLNVFGGYLRTRHEDGVHYLDYVDTFGQECAQKIEFGVNLLNMERQLDAQEICTVLIPLGATQGENEALTIASVNEGVPYIENPAAIALYGRITKTHTWGHVTDPSELLELGNEYLHGIALNETMTIQAVDLHLLNVDTDAIRLGDNVHLLSDPHGMDRRSICAAMDIDLQNGDMSTYTFGLPKQTLAALAAKTTQQVQSVSGSIGSQWQQIEQERTEYEEKTDTTLEDILKRLTQAETDIDSAEKDIATKASQESVDALAGRMTSAEVRLDGVEGDVDALAERLTQAETDIDNAEKAIATKASQESVDALAKRLTEAEGRIGTTETVIAQKADKDEVEELGAKLTDATLTIDEANALITAQAYQIDTLEGKMSNAELRIDGAEAEISAKASQSELNALGVRMSSAELWIDGADGRIDAKASQTDLGLLSSRVSSAELAIDGAEAEISMKASQSSVDALGKRVSSAELLIDRAESKIEAKADLILLDGYVKATDFEAKTLSVIEGAYIDDLHIASLGVDSNASFNGSINVEGTASMGDIDCTAIDATSIACTGLTMSGTAASWKSVDIITDIDYSVSTATTPPFYNANGTMVANGLQYVNQVIITKKTATISYLGS